MTGWLLAAALCQSLDFASTYVALHREGFREGNGLMASHPYTVKIAANVGVFTLHTTAWKRNRNGKRASAVILAGAGCLAGGLNLHTMRAR